MHETSALLLFIPQPHIEINAPVLHRIFLSDNTVVEAKEPFLHRAKQWNGDSGQMLC